MAGQRLGDRVPEVQVGPVLVGGVQAQVHAAVAIGQAAREDPIGPQVGVAGLDGNAGWNAAIRPVQRVPEHELQEAIERHAERERGLGGSDDVLVEVNQQSTLSTGCVGVARRPAPAQPDPLSGVAQEQLEPHVGPAPASIDLERRPPAGGVGAAEQVVGREQVGVPRAHLGAVGHAQHGMPLGVPVHEREVEDGHCTGVYSPGWGVCWTCCSM